MDARIKAEEFFETIIKRKKSLVMKTLIIYYSYEGNCEAISKTIQEETGADVLCIEPQNEKKTKSLFRDSYGAVCKSI